MKTRRKLFNIMMTVVLMLGLMPSGALVAFADDQTDGEGDTVHDSAAIGDADGATSRVIVKVSDDGGATAEEVESQSEGGQVVGQVKDVFVVEYGSADEAARAQGKLDAVYEHAEVDAEVVACDERAANLGDVGGLVSGVEPGAGPARIALVDSGAPDSPRVKRAVTVIGGGTEDESGHATAMLDAMEGFGGDFEVSSYKVLDAGNRGTVSSLYAGIVAALDEGVDIMNLSLVARATENSAIIAQALGEAIEGGVVVVAAAGNAGSDASGFVPACLDGAVTVGACDEVGARLPESNFGDAVDVYATAPSTSVAAAMMSGWLAANRNADGSFPGADAAASASGAFVLGPSDPAEAHVSDLEDDLVEGSDQEIAVNRTELRQTGYDGAVVDRTGSLVGAQDIIFDDGGELRLLDSKTHVHGCDKLYSAGVTNEVRTAGVPAGGEYLQKGAFVPFGNPGDGPLVNSAGKEDVYVTSRHGLWLKLDSSLGWAATSTVTGSVADKISNTNLAVITFEDCATKVTGTTMTRLDFHVAIESVRLRTPNAPDAGDGVPGKANSNINGKKSDRILIASTPHGFTLSAFPNLVNHGGKLYYGGPYGERIVCHCYFTPAGSGRNGNYIKGSKNFSFYDVDTSDNFTADYSGDYREAVQLWDGFEKQVYRQSNIAKPAGAPNNDGLTYPLASKLAFDTATGWVKANGGVGSGNWVSQSDCSQWLTGVVARSDAGANRMRFIWTGSNCSTSFFEEFSPIRIFDRDDATNAGVSDQGIIWKNVSNKGSYDTDPIGSPGHKRVDTANRTTELPWRGNAKYIYTARPGFKVVNVSVKGLSDNVTNTITNATAAAAGTVFNDTGDAGTRMTKQDYQIVVKTAKVGDRSATIQATKSLAGGTLEEGQFKFRVYTDAGCAEGDRLMIDKDTKRVKSSSANADNVEATNKADGTVTFPEVRYQFSGDPGDYPKTHTYYVKEVQPDGGWPAQVVRDTSVKTLTVTEGYSESGGYAVSCSGDLSFRNTFVPDESVELTAKKTLSGGTLRAGQFKFRAYKDAECTMGQRLMVDGSTGLVSARSGEGVVNVEGTNDASGDISFPTVRYRFSGDPGDYPKTHTYYVKEVQPDGGWDPQVTYDTSVKTVTVTERYTTAGGYTVSVSGNRMSFTNTYSQKKCGVKVRKVSSAAGNPAVPGVTFSVYKTSANDYASIVRGVPVATMPATDADGVTQLDGSTFAVDGSEYRVIETAAPTGFAVNTSWVGKFTASEEEADGKVYDLGTVTDAPVGGVEVKKADKDSGAALQGAKFGVYRVPDLGHDPSYEDVVGSGTLLLEATTQADGVARTENRLDADGRTYYVVETAAPFGYDVNKAWVKKFTLTAPGQVADFTREGLCLDKRIALPVTGGPGVAALGAAGLAMALAGALARRRRDTPQDLPRSTR